MDTGFLHGDIFHYEVVKHLSGRDILNFYYLNLIDLEYTKKLLIEVILNKLWFLFGDKCKDLLDVLKKGAGITGSFILSMIDGRNYWNDIDFCANVEIQESCLDFIEKKLGCDKYKDGGYLQSWWKDNGLDHIDSVYNINFNHSKMDYDCACYSKFNKKECEHSTQMGASKFQLISLNMAPKEYVQTFDLDIVRNLFSWDPKKGFTLQIENMDNIYHKKAVLSYDNTNTNISEKRLERYIYRGFRINFNDEWKIKMIKNLVRSRYGQLFQNESELYEGYDKNILPCKDVCVFDTACQNLIGHTYKHQHISNGKVYRYFTKDNVKCKEEDLRIRRYDILFI